MRTRTSEIDNKIIELYQIAGQRVATVAEAIGWPMVTAYREYKGIRHYCLVLWDDEIVNLSDEEIATRITKFTKLKHKATPQLRFKEVM